MRVIVYLESPDEALSQFIKSEIPEAAVMYGSSETIKNALKITVDKNVADNEWHHIVMAMNTSNNTWSAYVDGINYKILK